MIGGIRANAQNRPEPFTIFHYETRTYRFVRFDIGISCDRRDGDAKFGYRADHARPQPRYY
jgi:hypothetical protein